MSYKSTNRTRDLREGNLRKRRITKTPSTTKIYGIGTVVEFEEEEVIISCSRMTDKGVVYDVVGKGVYEFNVKPKDISLIAKADAESIQDLKKLMKEKY